MSTDENVYSDVYSINSMNNKYDFYRMPNVLKYNYFGSAHAEEFTYVRLYLSYVGERDLGTPCRAFGTLTECSKCCLQVTVFRGHW